MEPTDPTEADLLWQDMEALLKRAQALEVRSRNLSLFITNLENAQDKLRRYIVDGT
jgi:hypothetical protein